MKDLSHIAFIMDGNRRWAREKKLPLLFGHRQGAKRIEPLVEHAAKNGIKFITFWAFSSENWMRGEKEVEFLMRVFREFIKGPVAKRMMEKGVRVKVIGDYRQFPQDIVKDVCEIIEKSKDNKSITAVFALNYGGRAEILRAVNVIASAAKQSTSAIESDSTHPPSDLLHIINEEKFSDLLYTKDLPDPDMIVRTGGEMRLSGFLPWQAVYSELYFTDKFWPDFSTEEFDKAIEEYKNRERRFGK